MINVKSQVYNAIRDIADNVSDGYPKAWDVLPAIQYCEEDNTVSVWADGQEVESSLRYRIDVWHNQSTSETVLQVDEAVSALGLRRTMCSDVDDPSGLKHKVLRYEGIINIEDERVYQRNL